jgi:hypothetical protein
LKLVRRNEERHIVLTSRSSGLTMRKMSAQEIKDRYGAFVEAARREPVIHTSHGRPMLVTISIDSARRIPQLRDALEEVALAVDRKERLARLLALGGAGEKIVGVQSVQSLARRSHDFRGHE